MNLYDFIPGRLSRIAVGQSDLNLSRDPRDRENQILSRAPGQNSCPGLVTRHTHFYSPAEHSHLRCSDNFRPSPRSLLVERLGQNLPVGELDGKAEQQAFGRGASIACRSARSVTPGAGGTYLSSKVETGENEL